MKYCTKCGRALSDDAMFCDGCGTAVNAAPAAAPAAQSAPQPAPQSVPQPSPQSAQPAYQAPAATGDAALRKKVSTLCLVNAILSALFLLLGAIGAPILTVLLLAVVSAAAWVATMLVSKGGGNYVTLVVCTAISLLLSLIFVGMAAQGILKLLFLVVLAVLGVLILIPLCQAVSQQGK